MLEFEFHQGGIFLPHLDLWLDPHQPQIGPERVFISHAHSDHIDLHREVILSAPTAKLMQARLGGKRTEQILGFGETRLFQAPELDYHITLLPAGHIFGSAMSLISTEKASLLYTGDFKLRRGLSAEPCEPRHADTLIMETTYGRPQYRFPPTAEVIAGVVRFCREALNHDETPVLLGYSLGKSQELLCSLGDAGLPIMLHGTVFKLTRIYEQFGQCFPPYQAYESEKARGRVLLCPPNVAGSAMIKKMGRVRLAVLTGWAVDPSCRYRYGADAAFPLSDHADFPDLVELVKQVAPRKVFTLHGFAADFARHLRELGFDAQALSEAEQMMLPLSIPDRKAERKGPLPAMDQTPARPEDKRIPLPREESFEQFAIVCQAIAFTNSKLQKIAELARYLRWTGLESLASVVTWFTGTPFASSENKVMQLGWALLREAMCFVGGVSAEDFHHVYLKHSDLGETAFEIVNQHPPPSNGARLSLVDVAHSFTRLHSARSAERKLAILIEALKRCEPLEAKFLVKILTSDLRIGLKEGLVEEGIAHAFNASPDDIRQANLLLGNAGETAVLARENKLKTASLKPFRPVKFMLASPEPTAADIWERMQNLARDRIPANPSETSDSGHSNRSQVALRLEDKYDGVRCQLHKADGRVALYSRDLKEITGSFPEIAETALHLKQDVILDGEILAMRGEDVLSFAVLQRRLGRREPDLFMRDQFPIKFVVFDLLWVDGCTKVNAPLRVRWEELQKLCPLPEQIRLVQVAFASSADEIHTAFEAARARNNEGLMIKDAESTYTPGRRGLSWLKLKMAFDTLDCVVVGAEYGHGKRKNVLSDYTFAVRDENSGELKTIGKAYSGLTDQEIAELTSHFLGHVIHQSGRYHEVTPDTVLEIAFDRLQPSKRHTSGLAMRFPRILRIRRDKAADQIDTVASAKRLVRSQDSASSSQGGSPAC